MRIGVTGGAGFIGGHVVDQLKQRGHEPVVFDHLGRGRADRSYVEDDVTVFMGDVRDETAMRELAAHVDGIIHLAAVLGTQETIRHPTPAVMTNVVGGLNFLEAITQYQLPGVYICVGNFWMENPYSISKTTVERLANMYRKDRGTWINNVRVVNAYGPGQAVAAPFGPGKVRKITPAFICRALCGRPIEVYGDGTQISDLVYVHDVARVLVEALEHATRRHTYDFALEIGPVAHSTVNEVAERVARLVAERLGTGAEPVPLRHLPMRPGEVAGDHVTADLGTLRKVGITTTDLVPLDAGLRTTIDWYIENEGKTWSRP